MALLDDQFSLRLLLHIVLNVANYPELFHVCGEVQNLLAATWRLMSRLVAYFQGTLLDEKRPDYLLLSRDGRL